MTIDQIVVRYGISRRTFFRRVRPLLGQARKIRGTNVNTWPRAEVRKALAGQGESKP